MPRAQSADSLAGAVATGDAEAATRNTAEHAGMAVHDPPPDLLSAAAADGCSYGSNYGSNGFIRCRPRSSHAHSTVPVPWPLCCACGSSCGKSKVLHPPSSLLDHEHEFLPASRQRRYSSTTNQWGSVVGCTPWRWLFEFRWSLSRVAGQCISLHLITSLICCSERPPGLPGEGRRAI